MFMHRAPRSVSLAVRIAFVAAGAFLLFVTSAMAESGQSRASSDNTIPSGLVVVRHVKNSPQKDRALERALDNPLISGVGFQIEWRDIEPLEHRNWLGTLLVADLLRQRGKALSHLPCLNVGLRAIPGIVTLAIFTCQAANSPSAGRHKINRLRQGPQSQNGLEIGYTRPT